MKSSRKDGRGHRPAHVPTEESRTKVRVLCAFNLLQDEIADYVGIDKKTLHKYYKPELRNARGDLKTRIGATVADLALGRPAVFDGRGNILRAEVLPDKACAIFLAKTVLGLREVQVHRVGGDPENSTPVPVSYELKVSRDESKF